MVTISFASDRACTCGFPPQVMTDGSSAVGTRATIFLPAASFAKVRFWDVFVSAVGPFGVVAFTALPVG